MAASRLLLAGGALVGAALLGGGAALGLASATGALDHETHHVGPGHKGVAGPGIGNRDHAGARAGVCRVVSMCSFSFNGLLKK